MGLLPGVLLKIIGLMPSRSENKAVDIAMAYMEQAYPGSCATLMVRFNRFYHCA
jgi:hypothetical protein